MGRPILRLATRLNRRTRLTMWAIAFACMLLVGSLSLVDGLSAGVDSVTGRFQTGPYVYTQGSDLLASSIDPGVLGVLAGTFEVLRVHTGLLAMNGIVRTVVVGSLEVHDGGSVSVPFPAPPSNSVALDAGLRQEIASASGAPVNATVGLTVFGESHPDLPVAAAPSGRPELLPDDWAWVRPDLLGAMDPTLGGSVQAILTDSPLDPATVSSLGLTGLATVGAVGFAQSSVAEARDALDVLAWVIGAVIALLVAAALGLEVVQREPEIRTLRSLGAPSRTVALLLGGQAVLLAVLGASLGSALGILGAHAIVSFAPLLGVPSLIALSPPLTAIGLAYATAMAASLVGAVVPTLRAVRAIRSAAGAIPS